MLIHMCTAALFEILSFGVHLSMCFTVSKERAYIPRYNLFFPWYGAACGRLQGRTPGSTTVFGLKTLSRNHPLVTQQNIAGS